MKPSSLKPELAMVEHLVRDHAAEIAGAGNQHALEPDAGLPPALERFAHQLAGQVGEQHVDDQEQRPADLRDLVDAGVLQVLRQVVGADDQGAEHAEHDRQDAADEDREEVVEPRAAAAQAIEPLHVEGDRHQHGHERQHVDVPLEGRDALDRRDQLRDRAVKPQQVGERKRRHAERGVGQHVEQDEQAVEAPYHCLSGSSLSRRLGRLGSRGRSSDPAMASSSACLNERR